MRPTEYENEDKKKKITPIAAGAAATNPTQQQNVASRNENYLIPRSIATPLNTWSMNKWAQRLGDYYRNTPYTQGPSGRIINKNGFGQNFANQVQQQQQQAAGQQPIADKFAAISGSPMWREDLSGILMSPDEYNVRNTMNRMYGNLNDLDQASYNAWFQDAAKAAAAGVDISSGSEWAKTHPRPRMANEPTYQEEFLRNLAAPTGYAWSPFGTGYVKQPELSTPGSTDIQGGAGAQQQQVNNANFFGGYGGYSSANDINKWYQSMVQWRINQPQGG